MADPASPPLWLWLSAVLGAVAGFGGFWLYVGAVLAEASGWRALARRYRYSDGRRPPGRRLMGHVHGVGQTGESNATRMILADGGLYLERTPLSRFRRPSVLVPWPAVGYVAEHKAPWGRMHTLDLGGVTTLQVTDRAYRAITPYLAGGDRPPAAQNYPSKPSSG